MTATIDRDISSLQEAIALLDEWIEHADKLKRELYRTQGDRDWWRSQSDFLCRQLQCVVESWHASLDPDPPLPDSLPPLEEEDYNPFP